MCIFKGLVETRAKDRVLAVATQLGAFDPKWYGEGGSLPRDTHVASRGYVVVREIVCLREKTPFLYDCAVSRRHWA